MLILRQTLSAMSGARNPRRQPRGVGAVNCNASSLASVEALDRLRGRVEEDEQIVVECWQEHDPEKRKPVFGKDHAPTQNLGHDPIQLDRIMI
jgi:hypothetical protein